MGKFRDAFAKIGFCESTADLERKPQLVAQIVARATSRADMSGEAGAAVPYAQRLSVALDCASVAALDTLLREDVIVCLDTRLPLQNEGWFTSPIHSGFYAHEGERVLTLWDDGHDPSKVRWLSVGLGDFAKDAINQLADLMNRKGWRDWQNPAMFGTRRSRYNPATKITEHYFDWSRAKSYVRELEKNPALAHPPVVPRRSGPQAPKP